MKKSEVSLEVEGIPIAGEVYFPEAAGRELCPTLCICHGVPAGGPPDPDDKGYPFLAERFCQRGLLTMIFNFRGTGISGGNLDLLGWTRDLEAVLDYLYSLREVDKSRLSLMGFSGGAAVSAYVAAHDSRVTHVILCACPAQFRFPEEPEALVERFRRIGLIRDEGFPPSLDEWWEGFERVSPIKWIDRIAPRPLLIVHGDEDEVVGVSNARTLYSKAGEPKELVIIEGGKHKLRLEERAVKSTLEWVEKRVKLPSG